MFSSIEIHKQKTNAKRSTFYAVRMFAITKDNRSCSCIMTLKVLKLSKKIRRVRTIITA